MKDTPKLHGTELRDIVKEWAVYYRETELMRIAKEDVTHFVALHPEFKDEENILRSLVDLN